VETLFGEESPWAVVNFAAESHVDRSIVDSAPFLHTNVIGTQVLLDASRRHGVERFLQVSTDEVYGDIEGQPASTEDSSLIPSSPYSASKAAGDFLCLAYARTHKFPVLITRSSNNYGPNQFPEKLIPLIIRNGMEGQPIPVYGDGLQSRDWLYVEDNCQAILESLERGRLGAVYNVGGGGDRPNIEVVRTICALLAEEAGLDHDALQKQIRFVQDRPGHDRRYALDIQKISSELGWKPSVAFAEGLRRTVRWYLDNRTWVERAASGAFRDYYNTVYGESWGRGK
jgi:dTDP-glucose 4,6-dehydratase